MKIIIENRKCELITTPLPMDTRQILINCTPEYEPYQIYLYKHSGIKDLLCDSRVQLGNLKECPLGLVNDEQRYSWLSDIFLFMYCSFLRNVTLLLPKYLADIFSIQPEFPISQLNFKPSELNGDNQKYNE